MAKVYIDTELLSSLASFWGYLGFAQGLLLFLWAGISVWSVQRDPGVLGWTPGWVVCKGAPGCVRLLP